MFIQILHDLPHLSGATKRDGVFSIKLGVVPVHFVSPRISLARKAGALLRADHPQLKWLRNVHPRIGLVVPD